MSATNKTWSNNNPPTCEDDDLNGFKNENNNLILGSGQSLSTADNQQTHKAVSDYASSGAFYTDSGIADAYVLDVVGAHVAPPIYRNGMEIKFIPGNLPTGASTINVAGLGVKNLKNNDGNVLTAGYFNTINVITARYNGTEFRIDRPAGGEYIKIADTKVTGTGGGSSIAGTQVRTLNTILADTGGNIVSLTANQPEFQPGRYTIEVTAPVYRTSKHRVHLYNITGAAIEILGINNTAVSGNNVGNYTFLAGEFVITANTKFEVRHFTEVALATIGLGQVAGDGHNDVFTTMTLRKVA